MSILLIIVLILIVGVCCALLCGNTSNTEQVTYTSNGNKKKCPNCRRELNASAINCGFCGYSFNVKTIPNKSYNYASPKKECPNCGRKLNASAFNCGFCGYSFSSGTRSGGNRMNTRHINKNGLSFDCPDYYDIGNYPSSDEFHKSIVALSKIGDVKYM